MFDERNELTVVQGEPIWWDEDIVKKERAHMKRRDPRIAKYLPNAAVGLLAVLIVLVAWRFSIDRAVEKAENRVREQYIAEMQAYKAEQEALKEAESKATDILVIDRESEALAKVLYGVKSNSTDDLKTYVWCVLNRVDNPNYPDTVEDVIAQPQQWMAYSEDNPVLEDLYQIAHDQLTVWYSGGRRPVSSDFVFMNWSPSEIVLRDNWEDGSRTHYWRYR